MKVIVCGAGEIGQQICFDLHREECELTVIDRDATLLRHLTDRFGVSGIVGDASDPHILKSTRVEEAGLIIAATPSDHVNIVVCVVARSLGTKARTMARLENLRYLEAVGTDSNPAGPVDMALSPEKQLAEHTVQLLESPDLFDRRLILTAGEGSERAYLVGFRLNSTCTLLNTPLRQLSELFGDLNAVVVGIRRHMRLGIALANDQLRDNDEVYVCTSETNLKRTLSLFGKQLKPCRRVVLAGAGKVGMEVARKLDRIGGGFRLKVIERSRERAETAADCLARTVVLNGSAHNKEVLEEAGIGSADAIVAVTQDDRSNLLVASQAKKLEGGLVAVSLVNDQFLMPLAEQLEIDMVIDPRDAVMSKILCHCRGRKINSVGFIGDREAEIIECEILPRASFVGQKIRNAGLPEKVLVGAVRKDGLIVKASPDTRLNVGDKVAFFAMASDVPELLEQLDSNAQSP